MLCFPYILPVLSVVLQKRDPYGDRIWMFFVRVAMYVGALFVNVIDLVECKTIGVISFEFYHLLYSVLIIY